MKSQTSFVAQQARLSQWAQQIRECNNRPVGMTVEDWCQSQGITKSNYYWKLRKVREELLKETNATPAFIELKEPIPEAAPTENKNSVRPKTVAIIRTNQWSMEITDQATSPFLNTLIGAMNHAQ